MLSIVWRIGESPTHLCPHCWYRESGSVHLYLVEETVQVSTKPSFRVFCPPAALSNFSLLVLVCPEQFITVAAAEKGKGLPVTRNLYDPTKRMDLDFPFPDQSDYFSIATQLTEAHNFGTTQTFSFPSQFSQPFVHFYTKLMNVQSFLCCQICARLLDKFGPRDGCIVHMQFRKALNES